MMHDKSYYSLKEAAELAECKPQDLLHQGTLGNIDLLTGVPAGIFLRTYDEYSKKTGTPFLMEPQLLALNQSYCSQIELNQRTEQSDFKEGYLLDSSGQLKRLLPSYGHPELNHQWAVWRTFQKQHKLNPASGIATSIYRYVTNIFTPKQNALISASPGESVINLELTLERLFICHEDLVKFKSKANPREALGKSKTVKENSPDLNQKKSPAPKIGDASIITPEPTRPDSTALDIGGAKQLKVLSENRAEPPAKTSAILRIGEVIAKTGIKKSTIYDKMDKDSRLFDPTFPKQVNLGGSSRSAVGWYETEIDAWIESRKNVRRN